MLLCGRLSIEQPERGEDLSLLSSYCDVFECRIGLRKFEVELVVVVLFSFMVRRLAKNEGAFNFFSLPNSSFKRGL